MGFTGTVGDRLDAESASMGWPLSPPVLLFTASCSASSSSSSLEELSLEEEGSSRGW